MLEYHLKNTPPYDVLLSQLGTFQFKRKYERPVPTSTSDAYAGLRQRPFKAQALSPGSPCLATQGKLQALPAPAYPSSVYVLGNGPVYLTASSQVGGGVVTPDGAAHSLPSQNGVYGIKGPWISRPEYPGPILVRGCQLDGAGRVGFEYAEYYHPQEEMRLDDSNNNGTNYGWSFWSTGITFSSLGCYGLQIDGLNFTDVITLKVISGS